MPTISIIIPVYNTEKYLRKCLDSIIAQSYTDFEAILVDDGSTDKSGEICDEYVKKDLRFKVIHKQNEGVVKARVTAFEYSNGDLITFVDSDDYVETSYLEKLTRPILIEDADMVSCDYCHKYEDGRFFYPKSKISGTFVGDEIKTFINNHYFFDPIVQDFGMTQFLCTKMIKREFVKDAIIKGDGLWYGEDQVSVFYLLFHCKKIVLLDDRLYYYMRYSSSFQASDRYDKSLWNSIITMLERCMQINKENLGYEQFRQRTWYYIHSTLHFKMSHGLSLQSFKHDLSEMRRSSFMNMFFKPWYISFKRRGNSSIKEEIKYLLLKFKFFSILYLLVHKE